VPRLLSCSLFAAEQEAGLIDGYSELLGLILMMLRVMMLMMMMLRVMMLMMMMLMMIMLMMIMIILIAMNQLYRTTTIDSPIDCPLTVTIEFPTTIDCSITIDCSTTIDHGLESPSPNRTNNRNLSSLSFSDLSSSRMRYPSSDLQVLLVNLI